MGIFVFCLESMNFTLKFTSICYSLLSFPPLHGASGSILQGFPVICQAMHTCVFQESNFLHPVIGQCRETKYHFIFHNGAV